MNRLSPVNMRLPTLNTLSRKPASGLLPSPMRVSISISGCMNIIAPASAMTVSRGSSVISTNCMSSPWIV